MLINCLLRVKLSQDEKAKLKGQLGNIYATISENKTSSFIPQQIYQNYFKNVKLSTTLENELLFCSATISLNYVL